MGLSEVALYLRQVHRASLAVLAGHFECDAILLRQMLGHWVRKGCVRCFRRTAACGGPCRQCPQAAVEMYEWLDLLSGEPQG